jgi:putative flavoprotein involved in K+ transport
VARGYGHLRLIGGKAWTLLTTMTELRGYEEHKGPTRDKGVEHGVHPGRRTWLEQRRQEEAELGVTTQPYVVIVGGGQGGIALGARLRRLNVPAIIIDKNERPGDSWRKRYKSLCLHDPVWYDHLPYLPFPEHWPVFSSKDKIADWLEMYTKVMSSTLGQHPCQSARDEVKRSDRRGSQRKADDAAAAASGGHRHVGYRTCHRYWHGNVPG